MRRLALAILCLALAGGSARAASPGLSIVVPRGGQRGTEVAVTLHGDRLADAQEIVFHDPGFTVLELKALDAKRVQARLAIAADCRPGEHALRLRTASGLSELRTFHVGTMPEVAEAEPNGDFDRPQRLAMNSTVNGVVTNEDVDFFAVEGKKGQRLTAEVVAMRLGGAVFDPYVSILDAKRFDLAACDDAALARQDSIASVVLPEDGIYIVMVREASYGGRGDAHYRLHVGTFPRPLAVVPSGGRPGESVEVRFLGDPAGEIVRTIEVPATSAEEIGLFVEDDLGVSPTPVPFRVSGLPNAIEAEPNQGRNRANPVAVPGAIGGVLAEAGDVDFFKFAAAKGQVFDVRVLGREIRSPIDPVLNIWRTGGNHLAGNDDAANRPDSYLRFTAPEDGEYELRVRDFLNRGGAHYAYRVEISPVAAGLTLSTPVFRQFTQERQAIAVPRGNRYATLLPIARRDFGGPVVASFEGLPPGVVAHAEAAPANLASIPVVFEAAPDAPLGAALARVEGAHADPATGIRGPYRHRIDLSHGEPNNAVYWSIEVDRLAVATTAEAPFRISIVEPKAPLVQSGAMNLRIVAERREGFDGVIRCWMIYNPPGVGSKGDARIEKGATEVLMPMNANAQAAPGRWRIAVIALADVGGPLWVSSQLATLEIAPPMVGVELQRPAAEQGQTIEVYAKLAVSRPFEGEATARLLSLPPKVAAPEVRITKDATEIRFPVTVAPDAPPGTHKNVFCQIVVVHEGEPVVHNLAATELRIDRPIPPKAGEPPAPPPPPPPQPAAGPAPPPPPSRLEQLRAAHARRAGAPEEEKE